MTTTNTKLELLKKMATNINCHSLFNKIYFNKFCKITTSYLKEVKIKEISAKDFSTLTGLNISTALKVLIKLNLEVFNK